MSEELQPISNRLDELEVALLEGFPASDCPVIHRFVPGLYIREIFMPEGTVVTSLIHNTFHPFVISAGVVHVKINDGRWERLEAPYTGITQPGTRRLLYIEEATVWTTFHPVDIVPEDGSEKALEKAVDQVKDLIIETHVNSLMGGELRNNILLKQIENQ